MSKRPEVRIALEKLLKDGQARNEKKVFRDRRRRAILVDESVLDFDKLTKSGRSLGEVGRRIRVYDQALSKELATWIVPAELTHISRDEPESVAGLQLPLGLVHSDQGLWLQHRPGLEEIGVNDRGDLLLRELAKPDPQKGPVRGAMLTSTPGRAVRVLARTTPAEFDADRREAECWQKLVAAAEARKTVKVPFKCAGIDFELHTNVGHLAASAGAIFFGMRDIEMVRIASLVAFRFKKMRRQPPRVVVHALSGLPKDQADWNTLQKKAPKKAPAGFPAKLAESRFFDAAAKGISPVSVITMFPARPWQEELRVLILNTDDPAEVRHRGMLGPLAAILAQIDLIGARTSAVVLSEKLTATTVTGGTGVGKSTAALFWSDRNEHFRRNELRRRYEMDIRRTPDAGRLGETGIQKELDRIMARVGILCQENASGLLKEGAGHWVFWACERGLWVRTSGFPGIRHVLAENAPALENARADFGGSGIVAELGAVNHACATERMIYEPSWGHLLIDPTSKRIGLNALLERNRTTEQIARRLTPREAVDWLLSGTDLAGSPEPLCNPSLDYVRILQQSGVTGQKLSEAYEAARGGDHAALGAGDARLGELIFDRLDVHVKLWLDFSREIPTWLVNGAFGLEITQDVFWMLSQLPELFPEGRPVTQDQFRALMKDRYAVTYGPSGEWMHITPSERRNA
jgi:hypothetical protein